MISARLRDPGRDGADADSETNLTADERARIGILQIENQLCEILDRIDVMMGRWRNKPTPGVEWRTARCAIDFVARQLSALTWFSALSDLNLQLVGINQIVGVTPKRPEATCLIAQRRIAVRKRRR